MGAIKLELPCPKNIDGLMVDPESNWSLDALISELNSLELKLITTSTAPIFTKTHLRDFPNSNGVVRSSPQAFIMRISDDEMEDMGSDDDKNRDWSLVGGRQFSCAELYLSDSDSSEDEFAIQETQAHLLDQVGLLEGILSEREYEHQLWVKEEIRNKISALETDVMNENEKSISSLIQVDKNTEVRREMDRKIDTQYRRKIAEALDNHLIAVQRDHEHRSQIEERRIRNDAAFEEAKRKEKAFREEKIRQEKAKVAAEVAKKRAEEAQKAALEAERTVKEAAEREAIKMTKMVSGEVAQKLDMGSKADAHAEAQKEVKDRDSHSKEFELGNMVKAAESALKIEAERLQKYKEFDEKNQTLILGSNKEFRSYELQISRRIKQIGGTRENVRARASELVKIISDPLCPQSISIAMFAKKIVSQCETLSASFSSAFACGHVIVLVTSQVPLAMDLLLAEFHKACIYTVPKHVVYSKSASTEKTMGDQEDGKVETTDCYLEGVESYMKLYGALVQTEVDGVQNIHGLKEGWAWLARLLNALPANIYTAVALEAFLKMAGFALFRKYKSQFRKILNVISRDYVTALEARKDPKLNPVLTKLKSYIDTNMFLKEPEGWRLQTSLLSEMGVPEMDSGFYQDQYHHQSNRYQDQYHNQSNRWSYHY